MSSFTDHPPFPEDVPTHDLVVIDYELVTKGNHEEVEKLWEAAIKLGFWYLKNHGTDAEAEQMFYMGAETMALPLEEKMQFEQGGDGIPFGYKAAGANAVDETGLKDTVEFINISKDDAFTYPDVAYRTYPSSVVGRLESTIKPFIRKSLEVNDTIITLLNDKLGLPRGTLTEKHALNQPSYCEARCIRNQPAHEMSPERVAIGAHTDFGSLTLLHNKLGGLQVYPPGASGWYYVKPIEGYAICNIGDALAIFSGGILRSNLHRVVTPPKAQAAQIRWSLGFFTRPSNTVELRALVDQSPAIAAAVHASVDPSKFETGQTASEWFARRGRNQRFENRTGPETWRASRGTEHMDDTTSVGSTKTVISAA